MSNVTLVSYIRCAYVMNIGRIAAVKSLLSAHNKKVSQFAGRAEYVRPV
jgi:hypothetical protein